MIELVPFRPRDLLIIFMALSLGLITAAPASAAISPPVPVVSPKVELWTSGDKVGEYRLIQNAIDAAQPDDTIKFSSAGSQYGTLYLDEGGTGGSAGYAIWFTPGAKFDKYVVILNGGKEVDTYGRIWKRVNIPLANIADISFWYHHVSMEQTNYGSWPLLYKQESQIYTDDDGYVSPYVILEISNGSTTHSITSQPFARDPDGLWMPAWEQWQITDNAAAAGGGDPTEALWHDELDTDDPETGGSGAYPADWEYLSFFQTIYPDYNVVKLMVSMGEWDLATEQTAYVDDITVDNMTYAIEPRVFIGGNPYGAIDTALAEADDDQTINVYPGTFSPEAFPIDVNIDGLTIQSVSGAASTIIDGKNNSGLIKVTKAGVTIGGTGQGFTITNDFATAPEVTGYETDYGILVDGGGDAPGVKIQDNTFHIKGNGIVLGPGADSTSGDKAEILDNTFAVGWAALRTTQMWGVEVQNFVTNIDILRNVVTVTGEITGGDMGFVLESTSQVLFEDNTVTGADIALRLTANYGGAGPATAMDFTITNNTFTDCPRSIEIWPGTNVIGGPSTIEDVTISNNTVSGGVWGIRLRSETDGAISNIVIKYNDIAGHTTYGVENQFSTVVEGRYNWWGALGGPSGEGLGQGDAISASVTYDPWLTRDQATAVSDGIAYHGSIYPLQAGWNTLSVPLALDDSANTMAEIMDLGDFLTLENWEIAYQYNPELPGWENIGTSPIALIPGRGYYIKMNAPSKFPVLYSGQLGLPTYDLTTTGWNLIGSAFGVDKTSGDYGIAATSDTTDGQKVVNEALDSLGANASVVISPVMPGQEAAWGTVATDESTTMIVGEGYWVYMEAADTLAGFEITPIYWIAP